MPEPVIWLRFADLKARGIVNNRTTLGRWIKQLGFPTGTMIGMNTRAWRLDEIEAWEATRGRQNATNSAGATEKARKAASQRNEDWPARVVAKRQHASAEPTA